MTEFTREYFQQQGKRGARKRWAAATQADKDKATKAATEAMRLKRLAKAKQIIARQRNGKGGG